MYNYDDWDSDFKTSKIMTDEGLKRSNLFSLKRELSFYKTLLFYVIMELYLVIIFINLMAKKQKK